MWFSVSMLLIITWLHNYAIGLYLLLSFQSDYRMGNKREPKHNTVSVVHYYVDLLVISDPDCTEMHPYVPHAYAFGRTRYRHAQGAVTCDKSA